MSREVGIVDWALLCFGFLSVQPCYIVVFAVVSQYSSELESPASCTGDVVQPSTIIRSNLDQVSTGPGSSSCCYDNGAAIHSTVAAPDLWCPAGRSGITGTWPSCADSEDLAELFSRIGLGKYTDIFQQQEVS